MQDCKMEENQVEQVKRESGNPPRKKKATKGTDMSKLQDGEAIHHEDQRLALAIVYPFCFFASSVRKVSDTTYCVDRSVGRILGQR